MDIIDQFKLLKKQRAKPSQKFGLTEEPPFDIETLLLMFENLQTRISDIETGLREVKNTIIKIHTKGQDE